MSASAGASATETEEGKGKGRGLDDSRWSGTESIHLLSAESSSATMCCSHCWPTNPRSAFDLLIEYCRRSNQSRRQPPAKPHAYE